MKRMAAMKAMKVVKKKAAMKAMKVIKKKAVMDSTWSALQSRSRRR